MSITNTEELLSKKAYHSQRSVIPMERSRHGCPEHGGLVSPTVCWEAMLQQWDYVTWKVHLDVIESTSVNL